MKKIILSFIIGMFLLCIISGSEYRDFGVFKMNNIARIEQGCDSSTYSNITSIQYPNGSQMITNEITMTKFLKDFYYYEMTNTSVLGYYRVSGSCDEFGVKTIWGANLLVTPNGYKIDTPKSIMIFIGLGMLILIGLFLFLFGMSNHVVGIKIFSLGLSILILFISIGYTLITLNYTISEYTGLAENMHSIYYVTTALLVAGGIGLLLFLLSYALNAFYKARGMRD